MFFEISFADEINQFVEWLVVSYGEPLHDVSTALLTGILLPLERVLRGAPPWLVLAVVAALAWVSMRSVVRTIAMTAVVYAIGCLGLWDPLMQTLAIMIVATVMAIIVGIPTGVLVSRYDRLRQVLLPVLDVMQTLPTFVYLIPILMLFGLGKVPAIFATVLYALPPLIRLTDLGIRQVDPTLTEAADSFGTTPWQLLVTVQLPLARPSIMAGINQTTMMSL
ncbi:MAG TPA: ABC transporter permease subunit, partial [Hydrogenophaga sp.]|nr:ABC transporter permease subunit [Hydrogenophaga sp.]